MSAFALAAQATDRLPWKKPGEVLEYHACGCADSCWVAEVRNARSRALKGRLRCDCEQLHATLGPRGAEQVYAPSCLAINDSADKSQSIRETLERLLQR
ncbi:hypothetical protein [Variovorax sp. PAMC26660]|uniref:hypothetical protein n=1 Tax=Variovorax sp. PAMC26660 TaxID=2762322 RepID=UPI00164CF37A|nr:hypothetical protein [Variovorax sp. PAMC26660]QNK65688.1 hypothetical protein H7F35_21010 [Variovorax sp. PAMC26660]